MGWHLSGWHQGAGRSICLEVSVCHRAGWSGAYTGADRGYNRAVSKGVTAMMSCNMLRAARKAYALASVITEYIWVTAWMVLSSPSPPQCISLQNMRDQHS